jgi:hypothetical protein
VNLGSLQVYPVADILSRRGIPIVFAAGLGAGGLPPSWQGHCSVSKPMSMASLRRRRAARSGFHPRIRGGKLFLKMP